MKKITVKKAQEEIRRLEMEKEEIDEEMEVYKDVVFKDSNKKEKDKRKQILKNLREYFTSCLSEVKGIKGINYDYDDYDMALTISANLSSSKSGKNIGLWIKICDIDCIVGKVFEFGIHLEVEEQHKYFWTTATEYHEFVSGQKKTFIKFLNSLAEWVIK